MDFWASVTVTVLGGLQHMTSLAVTLKQSYSWRQGDRMFSCRQHAIIHCYLVTADPEASVCCNTSQYCFLYREDKPFWAKSSKTIQGNNQFLYLQV